MTVSLQFSPLTISNWLYVCVIIALLVAKASEGHTSAVEAVSFRGPTKALLGSEP